MMARLADRSSLTGWYGRSAARPSTASTRPMATRSSQYPSAGMQTTSRRRRSAMACCSFPVPTRSSPSWVPPGCPRPFPPLNDRIGAEDVAERPESKILDVLGSPLASARSPCPPRDGRELWHGGDARTTQSSMCQEKGMRPCSKKIMGFFGTTDELCCASDGPISPRTAMSIAGSGFRCSGATSMGRRISPCFQRWASFLIGAKRSPIQWDTLPTSSYCRFAADPVVDDTFGGGSDEILSQPCSNIRCATFTTKRRPL